MRAPSRRNPLVLAGLGVIGVTAVTAALGSAPARTAAIQSVLPVAIGSVLIALGWLLDDELSPATYRRLYRWMGFGLFVFFVVGFWFGQLSRAFGTSFALAIVSSLGTGLALGGIIGIYAVRLRRANAQLRAQNERLDEFASIVGHDLRNPLNTLSISLELAERTGDEEHFERATRSVDRMEGLIDDLLALARQGEFAGEPEPVSLAAVTDDARDTVETGDATVTVTEDLTVRADRSRLRQLLENLLRNAVEHGSTSPRSRTPEDAVEHGSTSRQPPADDAVEHGSTSPGSQAPQDAVEHGSPNSRGEIPEHPIQYDGTVTITVGAIDDRGFYVADDGPGIPDDERGQIFETGYSTAGSGSGIGLAIVKRIVDAHDWEITVTDSEAGGARFEITAVETVDADGPRGVSHSASPGSDESDKARNG
ncbi:sensor histidine kinase [Halobacteriales archaeon SW_10_66_29]|nr:MAG: sensor histidine kinase [Halobacteriales archaeon SW_10_66_29]